MVIGPTCETLMHVTEGFVLVPYRLLDSVLQLLLFPYFERQNSHWTTVVQCVLTKLQNTRYLAVAN